MGHLSMLQRHADAMQRHFDAMPPQAQLMMPPVMYGNFDMIIAPFLACDFGSMPRDTLVVQCLRPLDADCA